MPEAEIRVTEVKALETRSGNTRFVLVDENGKEYSTFKESIAARLPGLEGRRARIRFHEQQRDGFTNVYLDGAEPLEEEPGAGPAATDEVAWKTAIDAAPFLLDREAAEQEMPPDELFEKLQPFKELVADDLRGEGNGDDTAGDDALDAQ